MNWQLRLQRLFEAARSVPATPGGAEVMPGHLRTRVLAHWRSGRAAEEIGRGMAAIFRGALVCAAVLMLASIAWSLRASDPQNDVAVANYELRADVMP